MFYKIIKIIIFIAIITFITTICLNFAFPQWFSFKIFSCKTKSNIIENVNTNTFENLSKNVCLSEECVITSGNILKWMDKNREIDPCQDFYQFSCGGFIDKTLLIDDDFSYSTNNLLFKSVEKRVLKILKEEQNPDDIQWLNLAKEFYSTCLKYDNYDNHTKLIEKIQNIFMDLKIIKENDTLKIENLERTISNIHKLYNNFLIDVWLKLDKKNTENYIFYINSPSFGLRRTYLIYHEEENVNKIAYNKYVKNSWELLYDNLYGDPQEIADEIVHFEAALANITLSPENKTDLEKLYNKYNLEDLQNLTLNFPYFDWKIYFEELLNSTYAKYGKENELNIQNLTFIVEDISYFENIGDVLKKKLFKNTSILKNYLTWRLIQDFGPGLTKTMNNLKNEYEKETLNKYGDKDIWEKCLILTKNLFGMALSYPYMKQYFSPQKKNNLMKLTTKIKENFYDKLNKTDWIDEETKEYAKIKAEKYKNYIAYPDWFDDLNFKDKFNSYYLGLDLPKNGDHFDNILAIQNWKFTKNNLKLYQKKNTNEWMLINPLDVNAYSFNEYNAMVYPAGYLEMPINGMPVNYLNYGAIGSIIGHEIFHGFDAIGRQFDAFGNLGNWWKNKTLEQFREKTECFVKQYGNLKDDRLNTNINGVTTLDENIADNSGLDLAFQAYKNYVKENGEEKSLPGLQNFTNEQLFFISHAQVLCSISTDEELKNQILTGDHPPNKYRIIGSLLNSPDFANAFNCPINENKCIIW